MSKKILTAFDVLKTTGILKSSPEEKLNQILAKLRNSHDAVFIFDKDKFLGVISYASIFKHGSVNGDTKVKNIVKMPPKLTISSRFPEIAKKMIDSQIYFLPVFDNNDKFLGIVSANRLFKFVSQNQLLKGKDRLIFSTRTMLTGEEDNTIAQVWQKLQRSKNSKIIILDNQAKMLGIISRYDLRHFKLTPQKAGRGSRIGEKTSNLDASIKPLVQQVFYTIQKIPNFSDTYAMMKKNQINSLILVDKAGAPIDIITRRDLLNTLAENEI